MSDPTDHEYPRPDFQRSNLNWTSLNGPWDFIFDDEDIGLLENWQKSGIPDEVIANAVAQARDESEAEKITQKIASGTQNLIQGNVFKHHPDAKTHQKRKINVPFVYQTEASGINERDAHEVLWYERSISDIRETRDSSHRLLLRFGAVDYEATVWINGQRVGSNQGGHVPFDIDVTEVMEDAGSGPARLTVRVRDSTYDLTQPRGKQYWGAEPESIFYTPSSGIWQNVWLEVVPATRIADSSHGTVLQSNDIEKGELHATAAVQGRRSGQSLRVEMEAIFQGISVSKETKSLPREVDTVSIDLNMRLSEEQRRAPSDQNKTSSQTTNASDAWHNGVALWSPAHPSLYTITIRLFPTTSGAEPLDTVTLRTGMRSLSWSHGNSTFLLNNQPLFQKLCLDQGYWPRTGMTPPSASALRTDIALAQAMGFNGCRKHQKLEDPAFLNHASEMGYLVWSEMGNAYSFSSTYAQRYSDEWTRAVKRDINHPCIIAWTPVNESWGYGDLKNSTRQREHIRSLVLGTKVLDPTRPVNDNCGWEHVCDDLTTFHDYADADGLATTCGSMHGILGPKAGRELFCPPIYDTNGRIIDAGANHRHGAPVICTEMGGVNIRTDGGKDWGYTTASDPNDLLGRIEGMVMGVVEGGICAGFVYTQLADIEQETNGVYDFERGEKLDAEKVKGIFEKAERRYFELLERKRG
ncbi:hypothetical protein MBLNU457_4912t1 [Dothideomycetes sp. NU457]